MPVNRILPCLGFATALAYGRRCVGKGTSNAGGRQSMDDDRQKLIAARRVVANLTRACRQVRIQTS
jgi:hypothetical protein